MQKWLKLLSKILLFGLAFLAVVFISMSVGDWADQWKGYFSFTDQIGWYILVFAVAFVLTKVIERLLLWAYRAEFEQPEQNTLRQIKQPKSLRYRRPR